MKYLLIIVLCVVGLATVQSIISNRFMARIEALQRQLLAAQGDVTSPVGKLPQIVREFAQKAGAVVGAPAIVSLSQSVTMRFSPDQAWQDLTATHLAGTRAPGFVWHAKGTMMGVVPIGVLDAYVEGAGVLNARLINVISVANSEGPATDRGELLRYLAEIPWTPDAILNNPDLQWQQLDATTVSVTALSTEGPVTLEFTFDSAGDIVSAFAAARPMGVGDSYQDWPWGGRFSNYRQIGPRRIPAYGEVEWHLPEGTYVYFRGNIDAYDLQ